MGINGRRRESKRRKTKESEENEASLISKTGIEGNVKRRRIKGKQDKAKIETIRSNNLNNSDERKK